MKFSKKRLFFPKKNIRSGVKKDFFFFLNLKNSRNVKKIYSPIFQKIDLKQKVFKIWSSFFSNTVLKVMFANKFYLGEAERTRKYQGFFTLFCLGHRAKKVVLDLNFSLFLIRHALNFISRFSFEGQKMVFIGGGAENSNFLSNFALQYEQPFLSYTWVAGTFTNWNMILRLILLEKMGIINKNKDKGFLLKVLLKSLFFYGIPSVVFIADTSLVDRLSLDEVKKVRFPCVCLMDNNSDFKDIAFPIPGNHDSLYSLNLMLLLFGSALLRGSFKWRYLFQRALNKKVKFH